MALAYEKSRLIASTHRCSLNHGVLHTPMRSLANTSQLQKHPMFRIFFFKKVDRQEINLQIGGKCNSSCFDWRGLEGSFLFVPLLPPQKYELELSFNDGSSWALQKFNLLAPFPWKCGGCWQVSLTRRLKNARNMLWWLTLQQNIFCLRHGLCNCFLWENTCVKSWL